MRCAHGGLKGIGGNCCRLPQRMAKPYSPRLEFRRADVQRHRAVRGANSLVRGQETCAQRAVRGQETRAQRAETHAHIAQLVATIASCKALRISASRENSETTD